MMDQKRLTRARVKTDNVNFWAGLSCKQFKIHSKGAATGIQGTNKRRASPNLPTDLVQRAYCQNYVKPIIQSTFEVSQQGSSGMMNASIRDQTNRVLMSGAQNEHATLLDPPDISVIQDLSMLEVLLLSLSETDVDINNRQLSFPCSCISQWRF
jgi:hypothetical protein